DWIAFFSAERDGQEMAVTRYSFVAALCVERKIAHTAIFDAPEHCRYREYLNLLIRPKGSGWEHFEPGLHPSDWHGDWLWRISERRGLRKKDMVAAGERHAPGTALSVRGRSVPVAESYVVF